MDGDRFDALGRVPAQGISRRTFLKTLAGGLHGGSAAWRQHNGAAAVICRPPGYLCSIDAHCCSGRWVGTH